MENRMNIHCALFETAFGWMGLIWRDTSLLRVLMPQYSRDAVGRNLERHASAAAVVDEDWPDHIRSIVEKLRRYAKGETVDFAEIAVDAGDVGPMRTAIYAALRQVAYGDTLTYGELAARAGYPGMAREIGEAMGKNPTPIVVPCHRVVAAGGKLGGFSAPGGAETKRKLLAIEHARPGDGGAAQASLPL